MAKKVIDNSVAGAIPYLKKVVKYKSLILTLTRRDVRAKFAQTRLGLLWAIIQPLIALAIFTIFFDGFIQLETGNLPYPVFAFSGMIVWYFFSNIVHHSGNALISEQDLIKKIYFPRIILPIAKALGGLVDFAIAFVMLIALMLIFQAEFSWKIVFVPVVLALTLLVGLAVSIWLSAITIRRRDLLHLIPYLVNYGIWMTPVFYPTTIIPEPYQDWLYYLNPIATIIELFRWSLLDTPMVWMHCLSFVWVTVLLLVGFYVFRKTERTIADYV